MQATLAPRLSETVLRTLVFLPLMKSKWCGLRGLVTPWKLAELGRTLARRIRCIQSSHFFGRLAFAQARIRALYAPTQAGSGFKPDLKTHRERVSSRLLVFH